MQHWISIVDAGFCDVMPRKPASVLKRRNQRAQSVAFTPGERLASMGCPPPHKGGTLKHPPELRALAQILWDETARPRKDIAGLLKIQESTLARWTQGRPRPDHRGGSGSNPQEIEKKLREEVARLREEVARLQAKVRPLCEDPEDTDGMIMRLKVGMGGDIVSGALRPSEKIYALRALLEIRREEKASSPSEESDDAHAERIAARLPIRPPTPPGDEENFDFGTIPSLSLIHI